MGYRIAAMQRLLKPEEVAALLGVSPATLAYWRSAKGK
jgi:DNA-binding transcriptional MerR regulator